MDLYLEILEQPRIFQWNFLQHGFLIHACFDIDGVLCDDPSPEQNDDGPRYRDFLLHAPLKLKPQRPVKYLVTSRLEKYRPETEQWLAEHDIPYEQLIMMDVATAEERRRLGNHASFKAEQYRKHMMHSFSSRVKTHRHARFSILPISLYFVWIVRFITVTLAVNIALFKWPCARTV